MSSAKDALYSNPDKRPPRPEFVRDGIPSELIECPRWVGWYFHWKRDEERWAKIPKNPHTTCAKWAKSNDPKTWASFEVTLAAVRAAYARDNQSVDGLGYVFEEGGGLFGLDIDECRNPETGKLHDLAAGIVKDFNTYTEVSPSQLGVKLIGRGTLPPKVIGKKNNRATLPDGSDLELYDRARFFTITGQRLSETPATVNDCSAALADLIAKHYLKPTRNKGKTTVTRVTEPSKNGHLTDDEIIDRVTRTAKNAAKGAALWRGDITGYPSPSEAELALCSLIAFYTGQNSESRIDTIFRRSELARGKWDRDDYRAATIGKALAGRTEFYTPSTNGVHHGETPVSRETESTEPPKKTGAGIIFDYFIRTYRPDFKDGNRVHQRGGGWVSQSVACSVPTSALIAELFYAEDAPTTTGKKKEVDRDRLPAFFRTWAPVAWGDLLATTPDEDQAKLGSDSTAAEEFKRMVKAAMLSEVVLANTINTKQEVSQVERRSIISWCEKFAKLGPWRDLRSKRCWFRLIQPRPELLLLKVAIRVELFGQLPGTDRELRVMNQNLFTRRCERYGIGQSHRDDRPHGLAAVVLADDFVQEMTAAVCDP